MKVSKEQVKNGISRYMEQELATKADGLGKFAIYFLIPQVKNNAIDMINQYENNPLFKDMFEEDGIDIDALYQNAKEAMHHSHHIQIMNFVFDEADVDKLYNAILNG